MEPKFVLDLEVAPGGSRMLWLWSSFHTLAGRSLLAATLLAATLLALTLVARAAHGSVRSATLRPDDDYATSGVRALELLWELRCARIDLHGGDLVGRDQVVNVIRLFERVSV